MSGEVSKGSPLAVLAGVAAFCGLVALVVLEKLWQAGAPEGFLRRPAQFVMDMNESEETFDVANPSVKKTFMKGLKERDWALAGSGLAGDFLGRFPEPGAGTVVPDATMRIRKYGGEGLADLGAGGFLAVLREYVGGWAVVERTTWRPFEFLLEPSRKAAYVGLHFEVGGRKADGNRADLAATLEGRLVTADGKTWKIQRLALVEGSFIDSPRPPWNDISDETGFSLNESEANRKLRLAMIDDRGITNSGGLTVADFNHDGFWDVLANVYQGEVVLFLNDGRGGFVPGEPPVRVPADVGYTFLCADLDNDGVEEFVSGQIFGYRNGKAWAGLYVQRAGKWEALPGVLEFDVPEGVRDIAVMGIVPADVDRDGNLDLFFCCYGNRDSKGSEFNRIDARDGADNYLFMNHGGLKFTEESDRRGITGTQYTYVAKWWDFDFDGDLDLFEGNDFGPNHLWVNDGKGHFADAKDHIFDAGSNYTMGITIADWENDGTWGMYISNMYSHAGNRILPLAGGLSADMRALVLSIAQGNQFYECDPGTRRWSETGIARRVNWADWSWGSAFFDIDNDGDRDLYVVNGFTTNQDAQAPDY